MEIILLQAKCAELETVGNSGIVQTILSLANTICKENTMLMGRIKEMERESGKQTQFIASLKAALNKEKEIKLSLINQLKETMFELTKTRTAHDELQEAISTLQTKRRSINFSSLKMDIECSDIHIESCITYQDTIKQLQNDILEYKSQYDRTISKYEEITKENLSLSAQLANEKLRISKLRSMNTSNINNNNKLALSFSKNISIASIPPSEVYTDLKLDKPEIPSKADNSSTLEEYFRLVISIQCVQACKIDSPYLEEVYDLDSSILLSKALSESVPFHKWHEWISYQLMRQFYSRKSHLLL